MKMYWRDRWHRTHKWLTAFQAVLGVALAAIGASLRADSADYDQVPYVQASLDVVKNSAWWVIPAVSILLWVAQFTKRELGSPFFLWDIVRHVLDELQNDIFAKNPAAGPSEQVTLFRHYRFALCRRRWPWSGWLLPVERSGIFRRRSRTAFKATDDGCNAEGVAGQAWRLRKVVFVAGLPDMNGCQPPTDDEITTYAAKTFPDANSVRARITRGKELPRSFCGIPVEVGGKRWGVIVIDSRIPEMISQQRIAGFYRRRASVLNRLLEKV